MIVKALQQALRFDCAEVTGTPIPLKRDGHIAARTLDTRL
jgi:hypothetical protein